MAAHLLASLSAQPVRVPLTDTKQPTSEDKYIAWLEARLQEVIQEAQDLDAQLYYARKRWG